MRDASPCGQKSCILTNAAQEHKAHGVARLQARANVARVLVSGARCCNEHEPS